jgi:hypothetical protein
MPSRIVNELMHDVKELKKSFSQHLQESGAIKTDLIWLKWINTGIAALVLFKLVADWIK